MRLIPRPFWLLSSLCSLCLGGESSAGDWPQWLGPNRDGVWTEAGTIDAFPAGGPKVKWRAPVAGGYAGPAVAGGKVFIADYLRQEGDPTPDPGTRNKLKGRERVLALDAATGKEVWKYEYDCPYAVSYPAGPRCTPTVEGGRVFALGAMGDLVALDAATGQKIWGRDLKADYKAETPQWGFCGHPLVDGDRLICLVGGPGSIAVAFDKTTGKELWRALSAKEPGYCPPSIIEAGGKRQLIIWDAEKLNGLDPETGKVYWSVPLAPDYGMAIMAPRKDGDLLFAGGIVNKSALVRLSSDKPGAELVWRGSGSKGLGPVNMTPFAEGGVLYGVDREGQLRAVEMASGKRLWETLAPTGKDRANASTAFLVKNGGKFVIFNEHGELILAKLTPEKYTELGRAKVLEPTGTAFGRAVVWTHPAFADKCVFARNDKEVVCVDLSAD
jgi:outer membrane protein assembly factor BamB